MMRSPSILAFALSASMISLARFSALTMISPAFSLASRKISAERLAASSRSCFARSASAKPSAICFLRCSSAAMIGGQTNFMQNHTNSANMIVCARRVALMFMQATFLELYVVAYDELSHRKQNIHCNTNCNHRHRIDQAHHHEKLGAQHRDEFRLTGSAFQKATAQNTDTDSRAKRSQTHHQRSGDIQQCICHFHFFLLLIKVKFSKTVFNDVDLVMFLVCHIHINDGQRHEDEGLQRDNQDMENCPAQRQQDLRSVQGSAAH